MGKLKTRIQQEDLAFKKIGEDINTINSKDSTFDGYKTYVKPTRKDWLPVGNYGLTQLDNIFSKAEYKTIKGDIHITIPVSHSVMKSFDFELHQYYSGDSDHENGISWNGKYSDKNTIKFNISYYDYRHSGVKSGVHLDKTVNCNNCEKVKSVGFAFSDNSRTKTIIIIRMVDALSLPRLVCKSLLLSYSTTEAVIKNLQDPNSYTVNFTKDESSYIDMSDIPNTKFLGYPYVPSLEETATKNNVSSIPLIIQSQKYGAQLYPGGISANSEYYFSTLSDTKLIIGGEVANGMATPLLSIDTENNSVESSSKLLPKAFVKWLGIQEKYDRDSLDWSFHSDLVVNGLTALKTGKQVVINAYFRINTTTETDSMTLFKIPDVLKPDPTVQFVESPIIIFRYATVSQNYLRSFELLTISSEVVLLNRSFSGISDDLTDLNNCEFKLSLTYSME